MAGCGVKEFAHNLLKHILTHYVSRQWNACLTVPLAVSLVFATPLEAAFHPSDFQQPEIRVEVDLVSLYVTVTDSRGSALQGLSKENFRVWEDGAEQEIKHFSTDDAPYTIGLVLDRSGSMWEVIDDVFQAALHTLQASKPEDEAFVIVFNDRLELVQDFTSDREALERALHKVRAGGQTAIYDAVHTALTHIQKGPYRKKALLVVTDGEDNSSGTTFRDLLGFAQENSAIIYVVGFFGDAMRFGSLLAESPSVVELTRLAQVTGGKAYFPKSMKECKQACLDTASELRHQYSLGYYPTNRKKDGTWRKLRVEVTGLPPDQAQNLILRTRPGYYAPSEPVGRGRFDAGSKPVFISGFFGGQF